MNRYLNHSVVAVWVFITAGAFGGEEFGSKRVNEKLSQEANQEISQEIKWINDPALEEGKVRQEFIRYIENLGNHPPRVRQMTLSLPDRRWEEEKNRVLWAEKLSGWEKAVKKGECGHRLSSEQRQKFLAETGVGFVPLQHRLLLLEALCEWKKRNFDKAATRLQAAVRLHPLYGLDTPLEEEMGPFEAWAMGFQPEPVAPCRWNTEEKKGQTVFLDGFRMVLEEEAKLLKQGRMVLYQEGKGGIIASAIECTPGLEARLVSPEEPEVYSFSPEILHIVSQPKSYVLFVPGSLWHELPRESLSEENKKVISSVFKKTNLSVTDLLPLRNNETFIPTLKIEKEESKYQWYTDWKVWGGVAVIATGAVFFLSRGGETPSKGKISLQF